RTGHRAPAGPRDPRCGAPARASPRRSGRRRPRGCAAPTLLARAGAPLVVAQRILRHSDPRLTANVYSRVNIGDLRDGIKKNAIPVDGVSPARTASLRVSLHGFVAPVSPTVQAEQTEGYDT